MPAPAFKYLAERGALQLAYVADSGGCRVTGTFVWELGSWCEQSSAPLPDIFPSVPLQRSPWPVAFLSHQVSLGRDFRTSICKIWLKLRHGSRSRSKSCGSVMLLGCLQRFCCGSVFCNIPVRSKGRYIKNIKDVVSAVVIYRTTASPPPHLNPFWWQTRLARRESSGLAPRGALW